MFTKKRVSEHNVRKRITDAEIKAYLDEITPFLETSSGSRKETFYTWGLE
jgi:hypothetical protein